MPRRSVVDPRFPARLRELREQQGLSLRELARRALSSKSHIGMFEAGTHVPTPATAWRLDTALEAGGELADLVYTTRYGQASDTTADPGESLTVDRRPVSAGDVEAVREFTRTFRALDNQFGGGHAHSLAAQYLDTNVSAMLRNGRYSAEIGQNLFGAAAELAHLSAWTAYDIGSHKRAHHLFSRALELSSAAGSPAFSGEILAARGHHAIHLRNPTSAVELARASQQAARSTATPALLAEALALEANAHALLKNSSACTSALRKSEIAFDRVNPAETPEWLRYFDEGYLAARIAHTLRDLGDRQQARQYALRAVAMSATLTRTRAFNTVMLATTYADTEIDQACATGLGAVAMATTLRSSRVVRYLNDLRRCLGARRSHQSVVARFEEQATEMLGAS